MPCRSALIENLRLKEASPPSSSSSALDLEPVLRIMAAESRFGRRLLAKSLSEAFELSKDLPPRKVLARVGQSDTAYVFLVAGYDASRPYEESEQGRNGMLVTYCNVLCVERPQAKKVVGLGFFAPGAPLSNEVVFLVINEHQTEEFIAETRKTQERLQIFMDYKNRLQRGTDKEYPDAA